MKKNPKILKENYKKLKEMNSHIYFTIILMSFSSIDAFILWHFPIGCPLGCLYVTFKILIHAL